MAIQAGDVVWNIMGDLKPLNKALVDSRKMMQKSFGEVLNSARQVGIGMTVVGASITAALGGAVSKAMDFRKGMAEIASLGVKNMAAISDAVKDVAQEYGIGLTDAVNAAYQALSSQVPEENIATFIGSAAKAAKAGMTDLTTAVELGAGMVNTFGGDVKKYFDQSFVAVKLGVVRFEELNASIGRVAPTFNSAKLGSDQMFAGLAALTTQNIGCAEAVSGLKVAVSNIIKPSQQAADAAKALDIDFSGTALRAKGLSGFMSDLKKQVESQSPAVVAHAEAMKQEIMQLQATSGKTKEQTQRLKELQAEYKIIKNVSIDTTKTFATLFGSMEAFNVFSVLSSESGVGIYNKALEEMNGNLSASDEAFKKIVENDPTFQWQQLASTVEVLGVEIGEALLPVIKGLADLIVPLVQKVLEWVRANPELTQGLTLAAAAVGAIFTALGPLLIMLPGLATAGSALAASWSAIAAAAAWVAGVFAGMSAPLILIAGLIGISLVLAWSKLKVAFEAAQGWVSENWTKIVGVWDAGVKVVGAVMDVFYQILRTVFNLIGALFSGWADGLSAAWQDVNAENGGQSKSFMDTMKDVLEIVAAVVQKVADVIGWLADWIGKHWADIAAGTRWFGENVALPFVQLAADIAYYGGIVLGWVERILNALGMLPSGAPGAAASGGAFATGGVVEGFAKGGEIHRIVKVGERGEEMVALPAGSRVMSNAAMRGAMASGGAGSSGGGGVQVGSINVSVNGGDHRDARGLARAIVEEVDRTLMARLKNRASARGQAIPALAGT